MVSRSWPGLRILRRGSEEAHPLETGVYEGELFYEILTDRFSGIGVVNLRGRVQ
jgi:hypothetical protein